MKRFLVIQTAFIGDVILATPVVEKLHRFFPNARIDFLLRKGNEALLDGHPFIERVLIWEKGEKKYRHLAKLIRDVQANEYDCVVNLHRFSSSGWITSRSKAKTRIGFDKNPFSFRYTHKHTHTIGDGTHEVDRNLKLIEEITDSSSERPKLYPAEEDRKAIARYQKGPYVCIAPTSVWFTKQWPAEKWIELITKQSDKQVYLLGSLDDKEACEEIKKASQGSVENLCGKLNLLQSAALMEKAEMNYVNDSAPLHLASAINAPVTVVFCSTTPDYGFGPLSDNNKVIETAEQLDCRPCGLHGKKECPKGHFKCSEIGVEELL